MPKGRKLNESPTRMHLKTGRMSTDTTALSTASNNADVQANEETGLSDTSLNLQPPNFFDKTPPELRVLIYRFTYCEEKPLTVRVARPTDPFDVSRAGKSPIRTDCLTYLAAACAQHSDGIQAVVP